MIGQRKLHSSQFGIICPVETPDGGNIGIKKHMSVLCHITFGTDPQPVVNLCYYELDVVPLENINTADVYNNVKVFVNGRWIGINNDPLKLMYLPKLYRRNGLINIFTSLSFVIEQKEIHIFTDGGRCCRPVYIVKDNKLNIGNLFFEKLQNNTINWDVLLTGQKEKKQYFSMYYRGDVLCPEKKISKNQI